MTGRLDLSADRDARPPPRFFELPAATGGRRRAVAPAAGAPSLRGGSARLLLRRLLDGVRLGLLLLLLCGLSAPALAQERGGHGYGRGGYGGRGPSFEGRGPGPEYARRPGYGRPGYGREGFGEGGFYGAPGGEYRRGFEGSGYGGPRRGAYGPPPYASPAPRALGPAAVQGFSRGKILPPAYWGGLLPDPRIYRLRRPPNGYGWVVVGPNAYLMQRSTGLILDTAPLY